MSLSKLLGSDLPITVAHEQWLVNNANAVFSKEALEFAQNVLSGRVGGSRNRTTKLRSSSTGSCSRRQVFRGLGEKEERTIDGKLANIFHTGNFLHLKWQMSGLTAGWLKEAEVSCDLPELNFGGTLDGILIDGSGFEFKTINSRGFQGVFTYGPQRKHIAQVHAYMLLRPDITKFSIVYENKDNGEWREFRVGKDLDIINELKEDLDKLNRFLNKKELPSILKTCAEKEGTDYRQCPYKTECLRRGSKWEA